MWRNLPFLVLAACLALVPARAAEKKLIVCSTTQVADFTRQVVGDRARVACILAPGADPHLYEPKPGDAKLVQQCDLVIQNGLGLEGKNWMANLAQDAGKPVVAATAGVKPLVLDEHGATHDDPHAWFDPVNAAVYVKNILESVSKLDPDHAEEFAARAKLYLQHLRVLDAWIKEQFNAIPKEQRILVTSHDAFNYFCQAYGFRNQAPAGWTTEGEITPEQRQKVVASIASFGVKSIFVETSVNPKTIQDIARDAGVKVGGELYSDSMGPAGSAGEEYLGMMRENVLTILHALK
ncbi:MAG: zinc ABC transporter substrate-binding protein [Planctomycetota bacterium]|nr:zinc ABC transporter substrate-binding protein [Planctomycetota bacterium]